MKFFSKSVIFICLVSSLGHAEQGILSIHVKDTLGHPISGMRLSTEGDGSLSPPTDIAGKTRIKLPLQTQVSSRLTLQIVSSPAQHDYVCISPWDSRIQIPPFENNSENYISVVVVERGNRLMLEDSTALRAIASRVNKENLGASPHDDATRYRALQTVADSFGISPDEIDKALKTWKVSDDSYEKGLKNYYLARYPEAIDNLTDAYDKRRSDLLGVLLPLADSLYRVSRYSEAIVKYKQVILLNDDDPDLLLKLASALEQNGDFEGAVSTATHAVEISKAKHGESSPHFANTLFALGAIYINHGATSQGMAIFDQAIKLHDFDLSRNDFRPMSYLTSLAAIQMAVGKLTLAQSSLEKAIEFANTHRVPLEEQSFTQATLASLLIMEGHLKQADIIITKWTNILAPFRPATEFSRAAQSRTMHYLCGYSVDVFLGEGRFGKHTGEVIQHCLEALQAANGPSSMASTLLLRQKATWEANKAAYSDAEQTYNFLLNIEERVRGPYHPQVLATRAQLASLYFTEKKFKEAETTSLDIIAHVNAPNHQLDLADMNYFVQLVQIDRALGKSHSELSELVSKMEGQVSSDPMLLAALNLFMGIDAVGQNDVVNATKFFKSVLDGASDDSFPYYDATRLMGLLEAKQNHLDIATSYFEKALKFAERDPDLTIRFESQVIIMWAIALSTAPANQEKQLISLLERLKNKKPEDRGVGLLWMLISGQRTQQKDLPGSKGAMEKACEAFTNSENATQGDIANCFLSLGTLQRSMNLNSDSEHNLVNAVNIIEEAYDANSPFLRPYLIALGDLYKKIHKTERARAIEKRLEVIGSCPFCESPTVNY